MGTDITVAKVELNVPDVVINGPSLEIGEIDRAGFEELGLKLRTIQGFNQFWTGDWGLALKEQHGEQAVRDLAELLGFTEGTVRHYMSVSRKYDASMRIEVLDKYPDLTFEHMKIAMGAPSPSFAIEQAGEDGYSTRELSDSIRKMKPAKPPKEASTFSWIKDPRIIKAEEGFLAVATAIEALDTATEDHAVAALLLENFYERLSDLLNG